MRAMLIAFLAMAVIAVVADLALDYSGSRPQRPPPVRLCGIRA